MPRRLASTVHILDPESHQRVTYLAGQVPDEAHVGLITNPKAWGPARSFDAADRTGAPFDPDRHRVADVVAYARDHVDEIGALIEAEQSGQQRKTLVEALQEIQEGSST